MWVADYGCFLVYETPDGSGKFHHFGNRDQVENFLEKREEVRHLKSPADHFKSPIQSHGAFIFIIARQCRDLFIKFKDPSVVKAA